MKISVIRNELTWQTVILLAVLSLAAYVRFVNLTHVGMSGADEFQYWTMGKFWAQGNYTFNDGYAGEFFRPAIFYLHSLALRLFGFNDYAIKLLHAGMDILNILLIFLCGTMMSKNRWIGLASSILYAFVPDIIHNSRIELVHIPSATFVLLSFLFYLMLIRYFDRMAISCVWAALSGLSISIAANIHSELGMLGVPYLLLILAEAFSKRREAGALKKGLLYGGIFSFSVFSVFIISGLLIGFRRVFKMLLKHATYSDYKMAPLELTYKYLTIAVPTVTSKITAYLFIGAIVYAFSLGLKKKINGFAEYAPFVLFFGYCFLFELLVTTRDFPQLIRLLIPFVPLIMLSIMHWYARLLAFFLKEKAFITVFLLVLPLSYCNFLPYKPALISDIKHGQTTFRAAYDILSQRVNENNRILVAPYLIYSHRRALQQDMYLGDNAVYIIDCQDKSLEEFVQEKKIRYIYIGLTGLDERITKKATFNHFDYISKKWKMGDTLILGECYGLTRDTYSLEKEYEMLKKFIEKKGGKMIGRPNGGEIYEL